MDRRISIPRRRTWPLYAPAFGLLLIAALWSGMWVRASGVTQTTLQGWFDREAVAGRIYSCGLPEIGGYPFRIELHCSPASMEWRSTEPSVFVKTNGMTVAAQVYQPSVLVSQFEGPLSMADAQGRPIFSADWKMLRTNVRGVPHAPERASVAMDGARLDRITPGGTENLFQAQHAELHGRIVEGSAAENPVIDLALKLTEAVAPTINPLTAKPFNANVTFVLRGLKDFSPKPWAARFREIHDAGGRIDITDARAQQGESIVLANGSLVIADNGHLEGQLLITVAGLDRLLPSLGLDRLVAPGGSVDRLASQLDRVVPGLGNVARDNATIAAGIGLLGEQTQLEGRRAVVLPLRFKDGSMFLGAVPVGPVKPLF